MVKTLGSILSAATTLTALGVITAAWIGSTRLIVPNRPALEPRHFEVLSDPSDHGMALESIESTTHDGFVLKGFLVTKSPSMGLAAQTREMMSRLGGREVSPKATPRGTIFLLHGRGGRKEDMLWIAKRFVAADFRCLVYDSRAHGQSEGDHCTYGKDEVRDLQSLITKTSNHLSTRSESIGPVGLFGVSLGAAVALQASDLDAVGAVVAVSSFSSLSEVVTYSGRKLIHRHLPDPFIQAALSLGGWRADFYPSASSPLSALIKVDTPLFLVHGERDGVIPISHGRRLFEASRSDRKSWNPIPEGEHGNVLATGGDDLYEKMILFYLETLTLQGVGTT